MQTKSPLCLTHSRLKRIIKRIVLDILKQTMEDNLAATLPHIEGGFWPNVLEESIKELDIKEEAKRRQAEAVKVAAAAVSTEEVEVKASHRKNKKSNSPQTGNDLST